MTNTHRFNPPNEWISQGLGNIFFLGFLEFVLLLADNISKNSKMIEIGAYTGESTQIFASTGIFSEINVVEPFKFNESFNNTSIENVQKWIKVEEEFKNNTRFFNNVKLFKDYSHNISNIFADKSVDLVYIDGDHSYEAVSKDIELYLPKIKQGGIMAGHDYSKSWPGVIKAVDERLGSPDAIFKDTSWMVLL
jgi:predicted O-methyltransferase YrrM